jgi:hypothetical protein
MGLTGWSAPSSGCNAKASADGWDIPTIRLRWTQLAVEVAQVVLRMVDDADGEIGQALRAQAQHYARKGKV